MRYVRKVLPNGLRIIAVPMKDNPTVTVLVMVEAGSKYETKSNNGISHFLEHMCLKGTTNRPTALDISHEIEAMGAQINAFTWYEFTGYHAKSRARNFNKILDVVSDVYLNSTFPDDEIKKEKGVIIEEINLDEDRPTRNVYRVLNELMYKDQPAGRSVLGTKKNIRGIKREDFIKYRVKHYVASATTVVVAGNVDSRSAIEAVRDKFSCVSEKHKSPKRKVIENQRAPQTLVKYKKSDQSHFVLGFRSFDAYSKRNAAVSVLSGVLGRGMSSRLFQRLRGEMGVCYYVYSYNYAHTDNGLFGIASGVDNRRALEVIEAILEEIRRIRSELVPRKELSKAKEYMAGSMQMGLELSDEVAYFFGDREIMHRKIKTPDQVIREIKSVTSEQVRRAAKDVFQNKSLNLALIGPFKNKRTFQKTLRI